VDKMQGEGSVYSRASHEGNAELAGCVRVRRQGGLGGMHTLGNALRGIAEWRMHTMTESPQEGVHRQDQLERFSVK
jgi:hypothetical protein